MKKLPLMKPSHWRDWYRRSLSNRITMVTLATGFLAVVLVSCAALWITYGFIQSQTREDLERDLAVGQHHLVGELTQINDQLFNLSKHALVVNAMSDSTQRQAYLAPLFKNHYLASQEHYHLALYNYRGDLLVGTEQESLSNTWISQMKSGQHRAQIQKDTSGATYLLLTHAVTFPESQDAQGYVALSLPMAALIAEQLAPGRDPRYWNLSHRTFSLFNGSWQLGLDFMEVALVLPQPLDELQLHLRLTQPGHPSRDALFILLPSFLLGGVLVLLLLFFLSRQLGRRLSQPIYRLAGFAREVRQTGIPAEGLRIAGNDEVAQLSRAMNEMLGQLKQYQEGLQGELIERGTRLNTIFDLSPDGFLELSEQQIVEYVNPAFLQMLNVSDEEVLQLPWSQLAEKIQRMLAEDDTTDVASIPSETSLKIYTPSLRSLWIEARKTTQGRTILYWRDVTRQAELDQIKSDFLATAAHELRTPMTSILGFTQLLAKDGLSVEERQKVLSVLDRQTKALLNLVNDLLEISRMEALAGRDLRLSQQSLTTATRLVLEEFKMPGDDRPIHLNLRDHLADIALDQDKFRRVLLNVMSNAFKYSEPGSPIEIRTCQRQTGEQYWYGLAIQDHGVGMSEEVLKRLGERFYRAHNKPHVIGTGLGLSMVKDLMAQMGGELVIESQEGQGTTVTLWFKTSRVRHLN